MKKPDSRHLSPDDWTTVFNRTNQPNTTLRGYKPNNGPGGSLLYPAGEDDPVETTLSQVYSALETAYPGVRANRYHVKMPCWHGPLTPTAASYRFVASPERLTTTSISVLMVPTAAIREAAMGFYFRGHTLPTLKARMKETTFRGLVGNLGYYMTADLIDGKSSWAHDIRFPDFPVPSIPAYIGFHWHQDPVSGELHSSFQGAHPAAVAVRTDGTVDILPQIDIPGYTLRLDSRELHIRAVNDPTAHAEDIVAFTPALRTEEIEAFITLAETSEGGTKNWQSYAPMIPLADAADRVHVFLANEGDGQNPREKVVTVWEGRAPLPSFGAVLSFKRACFEALFGRPAEFEAHHASREVQIIPEADFAGYRQIMGGFIPVVIDGNHLYVVDTVSEVMKNLSHHGNANSPISQLGRETENFHPHIREPAGIFFQTQHYVGWVLFDGRHELSIGASVVDVAILLKKMETAGFFNGESIRQALFIDGGSAMKAYNVVSDGASVHLELLNRVAGGARNQPNVDPYGLNLYSLLTLQL
jgi:hypothetical protein